MIHKITNLHLRIGWINNGKISKHMNICVTLVKRKSKWKCVVVYPYHSRLTIFFFFFSHLNRWIEACIEEEIPPVVELEEALRNGIVLAKLTRKFSPNLVRRIFESPRLQFRHSENINYFFHFLDEIGIPDLFTFELTDLYDKKNIPKVIYCVHALGYILSSQNLAPPIGDLVGKLEFTEDEIRDTQKGLDARGLNNKLPNFKGMSEQFGQPPPPPAPPEPTAEEVMAMELVECEDNIALLQGLCRGALFRLFYGADLYLLRKTIPQVQYLQSIVRGNKLRSKLHSLQEKQSQNSQVWSHLQAACRGALTRQGAEHKVYTLKYLAKSDITVLQSLIRGKQSRDKEKSIYESLTTTASSGNHNIVDLQSRIRGVLMRQKVEDTLDSLEFISSPSIGKIQAIIRGSNFRKSLNTKTKMLEEGSTAVSWKTLQSAARGKLFRDKERGLKEVLNSETVSVIAVQSLMRGIGARKTHKDSKQLLVQSTSTISKIQSIIRGSLERSRISKTVSSLKEHQDAILNLQSTIRGNILREEFDTNVKNIMDSEAWVITAQAASRGTLLRKSLKATKGSINAEEDNIIELQAICRGFLKRNKVSDIRNVLTSEEDIIWELQSVYRAGMVRKDIEDNLGRLDLVTPSIVKLQSTFRGIMTRFDYMLMMEEFEDVSDSIVQLQAAVRGHMVRKKFNDRMSYFKKNMESVIKIQSYVRAKRQGDAYKSLTSQTDPPLSTVKNFVHLLNDSDLDFEQEVELEQSRKRVIDEVRNNELLEQFITQLDVKIALLLKNKITLDEVVRHRNKGVRAHMAVNNNGDSNMFDLKALNKSSRRRLELYQGFFYILQTQPIYLAKLFRKLRENVIPEKEMKDIESLVMTLYSYAQKPREEFFLLQLIGRSIQEDVEHCDSSKTFLRGTFIWWKLVAAINRNTKERKFLKELLEPAIQTVIERTDLDLESDPLAIYRNLINNEELRTGRRSNRDPNLPVDEAIQDSETRATFVANLQKLREIATEFLNVIEDNVEGLPYHVRFISKVIFKTAKERFPDEAEDKLLGLVGNVLFSNYIVPAIVAADNYGIVKNALSSVQSKNLSEVGKLLSQIGTLKPFSRENVYLQPLNDYVKTSAAKMREVYRQVVNVADIEQAYEMNVFDDLTSHRRPTLYIKSSDIFSIHSMISKELDAIVSGPEDSLKVVTKDLGELPRDASEVLNVTRFTEVKLDLNPSYCKVEDQQAEINSLFVAAKRCLLYILRVQSGANLLEILVSSVLPEHEEKYKAILKEERMDKIKQKSPAYSSATALGDLSRITYRELKTLALEKLLELESLGKITREDSYQEVLNSIALDIRTKRNKRMSRENEMDSVKQTLTSLAEKETYLQNQLKTYNDYIEHAMNTLQTKKGKKKALVLPFTKQYFHMRDLQKSGRVPKFGSYKYTASSLFEKKVLEELHGYSDRHYSQVSFTFSSDQVGVFNIEAADGSIAIPGATTELTLDDLLGQQYNNWQQIALFDDMVKFNTNLLLHFIFKKFYGEKGN